jgi:hypothetical protein
VNKETLEKMLAEAEAELAAMHPLRRWFGWKMYYLHEALKTDRAVWIYLRAFQAILGVDLYKIPHSFGARCAWEEPRDIRLVWWHPVAWPLAALATALMILTGGLELVFDNGNVFRKRKQHRRP